MENPAEMFRRAWGGEPVPVSHMELYGADWIYRKNRSLLPQSHPTETAQISTGLSHSLIWLAPQLVLLVYSYM